MDIQNSVNANSSEAQKNEQKQTEATENQTQNTEEGKKQDLVPHQKFHEERERRKSAEERLRQLEAEKLENERLAKEKQGEFETLYKEQRVLNETLSKQNQEYSEKLTGFETATKLRIETQINSLKSEEDKEIVRKLLDGKSLSDQETLLPSLIQKFVAPTNINQGAQNPNKEEVKKDQATKFDEAKKTGNISGMLANSPILNKKT